MDEPAAIPPQLPNEGDWRFLDRYLAGDATADDLARVAQWTARTPANAAWLNALRDPASRGRVPIDTNTRWAALGARIAASGGTSSLKSAHSVALHERSRSMRLGQRTLRGRPLSKQSLPTRSLVATAILSVMAVAVVGIWSGRSIVKPILHTYTTGAGQHTSVGFSDGSRILLGPATTLTVSTQASVASTDVRVVGQAWFSIAHHQDRRFRVHIGNAVAQVLGTTFLVRRYRTDAVTRVVVIDGRVAVRGVLGQPLSTRDRIVTSHDVAVIDDSGHVQVTPNIAIEEYVGWTKGQLVFNKTSVRDIAMELGRAYNVEIHLGDSTLATQTLTWTVPVNQLSLADVVEAFALAIDAHVVRSGNILTIVRGQPISRRPVRFKYPSSVEQTYGR